MNKQKLIYGFLLLILLFINQQVFSQEKQDESLKNLIEDYIKILGEKEILGKTDDGKQIDPEWITEGINWLYLPQGIVIYLPVINGSENLLNAIGKMKLNINLGGCLWFIWYDNEKAMIIFEDSAM